MADDPKTESAPPVQPPVAMPPPTAAPVGQPTAMDHLIPANNPSALTSYYCGVFSLIPCLAMILGPIAIVTGRKGMAAAKLLPEETGKTHARVGLILGWITAVCNYALLVFVIYAILTSKATFK